DHRRLIQDPDARRLPDRRDPWRGAQRLYRRLGHAGLVRPGAAGLEYQPASFILSPAERGGAFSVNVLKQGQLDLARRFGDPAREDALSEREWTTGRLGLLVLRDGLAFFKCRFLHECPAGDHVLAVGKVVEGKVLDSRAKPLTYGDTGDLDGASALFP